MSSPILHVNLFVDSERLSPAPVRLKFIMPISAAFLAGLVITASFVVHALYISAESESKSLEIDLSDLKPKYAEFEKLQADSDALEASVVQVRCAKTAKYPIANFLVELAKVVPPSIQFNSLTYEYPTLPRAMPFAPEPASTNLVEEASLRISGRTSVHEDIAKFLETLQAENFSNIVKSADIPRGSFRQEQRKAVGADAGDVASLLFEVNIECVPRKFKSVSAKSGKEASK